VHSVLVFMTSHILLHKCKHECFATKTHLQLLENVCIIKIDVIMQVARFKHIN